ncbi:MAG TPA: SH3 domain-containing protein [Blastocatellia bacterium]|nr:SH3 domain-containing protein [Blastocatellia bacterium]
MKRLLLLTVCMAAGALSAGCSLITGEPKIDEGIVIAPKLKIRSSTAMVALEIAEVKRGDKLEILEQAEVRTPTRTDEWYKVRMKDNDDIVGWVEARYVINKPVVDKIEQLYENGKATPSQGKGRLKVQTKLRIEPGGDVVTNLSRGSQVEIVGKARTTIKPEKQQDADESDETTEEPEARTVLWYQVRLPDSDVLRAGWVGAQQVQLDVPDEILHLEGDGRRFTGWVVFDQTKDRSGNLKENYIGLMKSISTEGPVDFTRIWVLIYSPSEGRYINGFLQDGLRGILPVTLGTTAGGRGFTIHELDENGNSVPADYSLNRVSATRVEIKRLTPLRQVKRPPRRPGR